MSKFLLKTTERCLSNCGFDVMLIDFYQLSKYVKQVVIELTRDFSLKMLKRIFPIQRLIFRYYFIGRR